MIFLCEGVVSASSELEVEKWRKGACRNEEHRNGEPDKYQKPGVEPVSLRKTFLGPRTSGPMRWKEEDGRSKNENCDGSGVEGCFDGNGHVA